MMPMFLCRVVAKTFPAPPIVSHGTPYAFCATGCIHTPQEVSLGRLHIESGFRRPSPSYFMGPPVVVNTFTAPPIVSVGTP